MLRDPSTHRLPGELDVMLLARDDVSSEISQGLTLAEDCLWQTLKLNC